MLGQGRHFTVLHLIKSGIAKKNDVPTHVFYDSQNCIERFYNDIVNALVTASSASVPSIPQSALKPFWNADLDDLKRQSVEVRYMNYGKVWVNTEWGY